MIEADRPEFERLLREVFGALDKPLTEHQRNGFWRGLTRMSLTEFERCCERILRDLQDGEPPRRLGLDSIWSAKKRLRAAGPDPARAQLDSWQRDKWDEEANRKLLGHITRVIPKDPHRYGRPASWEAMKVSKDMRADASPEFLRSMEVLLAAKNRWAALMRAADEGEGVDVEEQNGSWHAAIREAEAQIAEQLAELAA